MNVVGMVALGIDGTMAAGCGRLVSITGCEERNACQPCGETIMAM